MARPLRTFLLVGVSYLLLLEAALIAAVLYWPNFEENIGALRAMAPLDMLREVIDTLAEGGVDAYVTGQHFFKGCNALGIVVGVLLGAFAVAGEVHRGTLEVWLARPFTRRRLLLERWIGGALVTIVPVFLTTLTLPWCLEWVDEEIALGGLLLCAAHESIFLLLVFSLAFLLSTVGSNPLGILLGVFFFAVLEFLIYLVKVLNDYSIYRWTDIDEYMAILLTGSLDWAVVLPMLGGSAALLALSLAAFARRVP